MPDCRHVFNQVTRERVVGISTLNYDLTTTLCCHQILYLSTCFTLLNLKWRQIKPSVYVLNFLETEKWVLLNVGKVLVSQSHPTLWDSVDCNPPCSSVHGFSWQRSGVGCCFFLQEIFPTQGLNLDLFHCCRFFTVWTTKEAHWM